MKILSHGYRTNFLKVFIICFAIAYASAFPWMLAHYPPYLILSTIAGGFAALWLMKNPKIGLMLLFAISPFEYISSLKGYFSLYRIIGALVFCSWLLGKVLSKQKLLTANYTQMRYLLALLVVVAVSTAFSSYPLESLVFLQRIILLSMLCFLATDLIKSPKDLNILGWMIGVFGGLSSLVGLVQHYVFRIGILETMGLGFTMLYEDRYMGEAIEGVRVGGFTGNPNHYSIYLVLSICFLIYSFLVTRRKMLKFFLVVLIICSVYAIMLTLSRAGIFALAVVGFVYAIYGISRQKSSRMMSFVILLIIGVAILYLFQYSPTYMRERLIGKFHGRDESRENRIDGIKDGLKLFGEKPFIGSGLDTFWRRYSKGRDPHNIFLQVFVETGLFGFTFFCLLLFHSYKDMIKGVMADSINVRCFYQAALAGFSAFLVHGLFHTTTYIKFLWLCFALSPILHNIERNSIELLISKKTGIRRFEASING